jgi:hypothetical protein
MLLSKIKSIVLGEDKASRDSVLNSLLFLSGVNERHDQGGIQGIK